MKRKSLFNRIVVIVLATILTLQLLQNATMNSLFYSASAEEQSAQITPGVTNINVRQLASTTSPVITMLQGGQLLTILDKPSDKWYHVSFSKNGTDYIGYVYADYVTILNNNGNNGGDNSGNNGSSDSSNTDFEAYLTEQGFPESYKSYLRELHNMHPEWKFVAVQTGLDWNTVIANEMNKQGQIKNLVQGTSSAPHYNWRETSVGYNWSTDVWSPYDGTTWFAASKGLVEYYMDPRTYMYETYVFAFEQLSYDETIHSSNGVEAILSGTFMYNTCPSDDNRKYSAIVMEAAKTYNVSPYHLASRMKQEMGSTAGVNATGTSASYPGIYNYFNIGANDSAGGGAVNNGLSWASKGTTYGRPWDSAYKAIMGGSQYIGESYINRGQDTLYTQKFNVVYKGNLYGHQYMSNIQAPATEAASMFRAYRANGLLNSALVFKIPVYINMPATAVNKPADSGNPNNWLKSLSVSGCTLTPTFTGGTTTYSVIVENSVSNVTVSAATVNSKAAIKGIGAINLSVGNNSVPITVTAQNGDVRQYTITIVRKEASGAPPTVTPNPPADPSVNPSVGPTFSGKYTVSSNKVTGVAPGTTASSLVSNLGVSGYTVTVYKADGKTLNSGSVGTNSIIKVSNGVQTYTYSVLVYGDASGDGEITLADLVYIKKYMINQLAFSEGQKLAADINKDGKITIADLVFVKSHMLGKYVIVQK